MNNKGSALLITILVVSIISFGLVTVHEFQKSGKGNEVIGTGLVLLDEQSNHNSLSGFDSLSSSNLLDNARHDEDFIEYFSSSHKSKNSKESGSSSQGSSSESYGSGSSDLSGLNYPDNNNSSEDSLNDSNSTNSTNLGVTNNETENTLQANTLTETPKSLGGVEVVKGIVDPKVIWFTKLPPSGICYNHNEIVDTISLGLGTVNLKWSIFDSDYISCVYNGQKDISVYYCLIEDDPLYDDEIKCGYGTATTYNCATLNLENFRGYTVKREFNNVALSSFFDEFLEGSYIEIYAEVSNPNNYFNSYSTSTYNVYKHTTCDCLFGPCCDLSSRPYEFKSSGSQPIGYTDYYYCSGTNSPTGTNYVYKNDYYCSGSSSSYYSRALEQDTCGTCEYCTSGDSTCNYYGTSTSCGTKDCDYLDTTCRDYHDVNKYCNGAGSCNIAGSCTDYTNKPKHTSCGSNNECDGGGSCIYCDGNKYTQCSDNDVYYYDYCDNRKEKKWECGNDYEGTIWYPYCEGNQAWKKKSCADRGCSSGSCYESWYDCYNNYVKTCEFGCNNGVCKPDPNIECYSDTDCPTIWSNPYCKTYGNSSYVERMYTPYKCVNSNCEEDYSGYSLVENCGKVEYSDNYCLYDDVYRNFTDKCSFGVCSVQPQVEQKVKECGVKGCSNSVCNTEDCTNECSSGQTRCKEDYKQICGNYDADSCLEWPSSTLGTGNENCGEDYCEDWQNNYCKDGNIYHKRVCYDKGCSSGGCYNNPYTEEQKVEGCSNGCTEGSCKVKVCKTVCNFGKCKEYCVWE